MNVLLLTLGGILGRMVVTSLGTTLLGLNVPPEVASKVVELVQALGPITGTAGGLVVIGIAFAWSYWQKKRSGVIPSKEAPTP